MTKPKTPKKHLPPIGSVQPIYPHESFATTTYASTIYVPSSGIATPIQPKATHWRIYLGSGSWFDTDRQGEAEIISLLAQIKQLLKKK